ncbi:MAG: DUF2007 domain-containing protein [Sphingobacteriaceae bacterium]|nr:MAG: DUF2007 domain-containing protein [Sphingobacteriaceae bacterium]
MHDNEKIVTLQKYYDPMMAEIHHGILETNGISSFIADNTAYKQVLGGIELKVFERDLEKSQAILAQSEDLNSQES